jgi:hypothetical protein
LACLRGPVALSTIEAWTGKASSLVLADVGLSWASGPTHPSNLGTNTSGSTAGAVEAAGGEPSVSGATRRTEPRRAAGRHLPPAVPRRCVVLESVAVADEGRCPLAVRFLSGWAFEIQISSGSPWGPGRELVAGSRKPPVRTQLLPASPCFLPPPFERSCFQQRLCDNPTRDNPVLSPKPLHLVIKR